MSLLERNSEREWFSTFRCASAGSPTCPRVLNDLYSRHHPFGARTQADAPRMQEHSRGAPQERCTTFAESDPDDAAREMLFPLPRCPHIQPDFRDISFTMVDGDFQVRAAPEQYNALSSFLTASCVTSSCASNLPTGVQGDLEDAAGSARDQLHDPLLFCICKAAGESAAAVRRYMRCNRMPYFLPSWHAGHDIILHADMASRAPHTKSH